MKSLNHSTIRRTSGRAALFTLLAVSSVAVACKKDGAANADSAAAPPAPTNLGAENIALVKTDTLRSGPKLTGTLQPEREAQIRAEVAGPMLSTSVKQGERVSEGAQLGRIDDSAINDQVISAKSAVTQAQLVVDQATRELQRSTTLLAAGAIAARDKEAAERALAGAQAGLADAKARQSMAEKNVRNTVIRAPFSGIVTERAVNAGDIVAPGTALFTIVDPASWQVEASVPADAVGSIRIGSPVRFSVSGLRDRELEGKITRINPIADATTRQIRIYATVPNKSGTLFGGQFVNGSVSTDMRVGLMVPDKAVDQSGVTPFVVRVKGGKVERVDVSVGLHDIATETMEITKGLAAGDTVLLGAAQGISVGTQVRVSMPKDAARPVERP